ncbi:MAG: glycosyltransferase family 2 protein, partial [Planctomycetaceae bacterium]
MMLLSVVIPAHDEAANLPQLLREIRLALACVDVYEVVVVDDGSTDNTQSVLNNVQADFPQLRIVRHASSCGQSTALMTGVDAAAGDIIATLDGDGQNDPADIPGMVDLLLQSRRTEEVRMIAGFRNKRRDSHWRLMSSRIANAVRSRILSDETPDSGCGIKVFLKQA